MQQRHIKLKKRERETKRLIVLLCPDRKTLGQKVHKVSGPVIDIFIVAAPFSNCLRTTPNGLLVSNYRSTLRLIFRLIMTSKKAFVTNTILHSNSIGSNQIWYILGGPMSRAIKFDSICIIILVNYPMLFQLVLSGIYCQIQNSILIQPF